jgi:hypothetical protein
MALWIYHKTQRRKEIQAVSQSTTVLPDLLSVFPRYDFENAVLEFEGDKHTRSFHCFDLFRTLIYGQIINAFSVREIENSLAANHNKLYRCGIKQVRRSTLCDAMEKRDHRIFQRAFESLVEKANEVAQGTKRKFRNPLKVIDATTIDICLSRFKWAKFRTAKGAIKIHILMNGDCCFPEQVFITNGAVHEVNELASMHFAENDIAVMDRGYLDYNKLRDIDLRGAFFVTRLKNNSKISIVHTIFESSTAPVRGDYRINLILPLAKAAYPAELRMVRYYDEEHGKEYSFVTNDLISSAQEIADIYKARWQVELFFKWIKQNLKIKTFWGTSENAVRCQIWTALILYLLLWIRKALCAIDCSLQRIMQILKTTILTKNTFYGICRPPPINQGPPDIQLSLRGLV